MTEILLCANHGLCTSDCIYRQTCKIKRVPFLIYGLVFDHKNDEIYPEEYQNEIMHRKVKHVESFHKDHPEFINSVIYPTMSM